jgi:hypothetical protein
VFSHLSAMRRGWGGTELELRNTSYGSTIEKRE